VRRRLFATVIVASLMPAGGCFLEESAGGFAAGRRQVDGGAAGDGQAGAPGGDGGAAAGGAEVGGSAGGGSAMNCSALPFGCVCSPSEPSQAGACTTASVVKMPGQQGVCCDNSFNCVCVAYECVRVGGGCSCQLAVAAAAGMRVDNCSAVTVNPGIKCCRSYGQCVCGVADCLLTETPVSGCSVQDLLACSPGESSVSSCEAAGAGGRSGPATCN
jgi:hypothetical protein